MSPFALRPGLPDLPKRMRSLPVDERGYPVPWFVGFVDGKPDFRVIRNRGVIEALGRGICWLCGEPLGRNYAFVVGPMCAINRTTAEPPSHLECADFAARACPFLTRPSAKRREANMPDGTNDPAGVMIRRNPGVAVVWVTRSSEWWQAERGGGGILCTMGEPIDTLWYCEGRGATREEALASMESGFPLLLRECPSEEDRIWALKQLDKAKAYLPPEALR